MKSGLKHYEAPHMEVVLFETEDVICTSDMTKNDFGFGDERIWYEIFPE